MKKRFFLLPIVACLMLVASVCKGQRVVSTYLSPPPGGAVVAYDMVIDAAGNIYYSYLPAAYVKKITPEGIIEVIAGTGTPGFGGDGGPATAAQLYTATGIVLDASGNVIFSDENNNVIRKIDKVTGIISTIAGIQGMAWTGGDGGPATAASFEGIYGMAFDAVGNLYLADQSASVIRKIDTAGIISTIAGMPSLDVGGFAGDGGPASAASLAGPGALCFDSYGNLYIGDYWNYRVRKIDPAGIITTVAGNGIVGYSGDGGPATAASIPDQFRLLADSSGIYITDGDDIYSPFSGIRKVTASGIIFTIAGNYSRGYSGDGGPAHLASFNEPFAAAFDSHHNLYAADRNNNVIRKIAFTPDVVSDSFSIFSTSTCNDIDLSTLTTSPSATALITYFGDGTANTSSLSPASPESYVNVSHTYGSAGTYTIKELLMSGGTVLDSIDFSYEYLLCNTFDVRFYLDANSNCSKDSSELDNYFPLLVEIDSNGVPVDTISTTSGIYYDAYGLPGDVYNFKVLSAPHGLVFTCGGSGIVADTVAAITYNGTTKYLGLSCSAATGFDLAENVNMITGRHSASGTILVTNTYCTAGDVVVTMNINPKYIFESAVPAPTAISGNTITWNFTGVSITTGLQTISYTLTVPGPWLTAGDTILSTWSVTPISGDADTSNNNVTRIDTVKSSYDPNEMSVIPGGYILPGTTLQYSINFENTGNDTAVNIAVMDTLSDNVDVSSLRIDAATAVMNTAIYNAGGHNIVKFDFPHIELLDSTHHNQCNGMVTFHIKTKSGLADGTALFNHAGIFFDDNPVVMTDTVENVISRIHGANSVCIGSQLPLSDLATGGVWTLSNASATISGDTVTGVTPGVDTISYTTTTKYGTSTVTQIVTVSPFPTAITGPASICGGVATPLSDAVTGGSWSSSTSAIAVIGSSTGIVTGVSAGAVIITYTFPAGCMATKAMTINPFPFPITGLRVACSGISTTLSDATAGGMWSSSNPAVATIGFTGVVTGTSAGTTNISYTLPTGCAANAVVTINPLPSAISGTMTLCAFGGTTSLSDATPGGSWSSLSVIVGPTGLVTGGAPGTGIITYTLPTGCSTMTMVTVNTAPIAIAGTPSMCSGSSTILTDATAGGFWSSSNLAVATVGTSGIVTGTIPGTATISYTNGSGCAATMNVTVAPVPASISGIPIFCAGGTTSLSDITAGGTWSSSNPAVGTVSSTGIVTGIAAGTTSITYSTGSSCTTTKTVTISATPTPISGTLGLCSGLSTTLTDAAAGGTWSSSLPAVATIGSSTGTVTGVSLGTAGITYTNAVGCIASTIVTVNPQPAPVSGTTSVCVGSSIQLTDATAGGTWSSSNPAVLDIGLGTGIAVGLTADVVNVTYSLFATGCSSSVVVTVNPVPTPISGSLGLCVGSASVFSDGVFGGTWSSSDATIASIGMVTGIATAISAGTATLTYTAAGCTTLSVITVNPSPVSISGISSECTGSGTSLSDASAGGIWSTSDTAVTTVSGSGFVTGVAAGTAVVTYRLPTGCFTTVVNTVNPVPSPITGAAGLCVGTTTSLTVAPSGGSWGSSVPAIAAIDISGTVTALATGTATISYSLPTGCYATLIVTVNSTAGTITGASTLCEGDNTDLSDLVSGGLWSSSTPGVATVATIGASSGVVIGIAPGVDTVTYAISAGCVAYYIVTVYAVPAVTATAAPAGCGSRYDLTSGGAASYIWSPATGLSCATCASTVVSLMATTTYTVTGTGANGCASAATVSVNGNRILGHVIAGGLATDVMKVWLIQFNAADSSLIAQDSMLTCMDGGTPYYEFDGIVPGNYLLKAELLGSVAGTTGYVPTYGLSSPYWDTAISISHTTATDTQHISMIHGVVLAGPGFIGGLIVSGAGRGTSGGAPVVGMLVYLLNATNNVLTYTYTDATGNYSFGGLGDGSYIVYPEDYKYYTTVSATVILTTGNDTVTDINFKQHTSLGTITPYSNLMVSTKSIDNRVSIYPNPASGLLNVQWAGQATGDAVIVITDLAGREVYRSEINITTASGKAQLDISSLLEGVYVVTIRTDGSSLNCKLVIQ